MNQLISPKRLADKATFLLKNAADPKSAEQFKRYFKQHEKIALYGIKTPVVRQIAKELFEEIKNEWSLGQAVEFCEMLLSRPFIESKTLGILLLTRFTKSFEKTLLKKAELWFMKDYCCNWATTDALSTLIITPLIIKFPPIISEIINWRHSQNLWLRRACAVSFVGLARKGEHLETVYEITESLFVDKEDLIQKAIGWLLREAGKTDPKRLTSFLLLHGSRIPRTTLRYAIEKFSEQKRKQILTKTK